MLATDSRPLWSPGSPGYVHLAKMTNVAGMENHLLVLLPALRAHGLNVRLIILVEHDKPMTEYAAAMQGRGVPTEMLTIRRDLDLGLVRRLARRLREVGEVGEVGAVALHTHLIHADLHGGLAARLAGVSRWYCSGHNDDSFRKLLPVRLFQGVLWRQVTAGIAISEALRRFMIDIEFAPPHKIHTVPYGFDPAEMPSADTRKEVLRRALDLPQDSFIFGSVCRLVPQKGLIHALHALAGLNADLTLRPAHYVIAGDGPLRDSLSQAAATLGVTERVHFLGWRGDARQLYAAFDAFLMPSLWEGFGLVALEAMAAGLPILASQVSALPEIILEGETGYLTPPAEAAPLAARMRDLVRDPARAAQMGQAGRRRLETVFSVQRMVEGTLRVYRDYSTIS